MTRNEIKSYILGELASVAERYNGKKHLSHNEKREHIHGQLIGMVKAFKVVGLLALNDNMTAEILDEI